MTQKRDYVTVEEMVQHCSDLARAFKIQWIVHEKYAAKLNPAAEIEGPSAQYTIEINSDGRQRERHCVCTGPIKTAFEYAVGLHEFGHILHPSGVIRSNSKLTELLQAAKDPEVVARQLGITVLELAKQTLTQVNLQLLEEESAWVWAQHHALVWTIDMQDALDYGFKSYTAAQKMLREVIEIGTKLEQGGHKQAFDTTPRPQSMKDFTRKL